MKLTIHSLVPERWGDFAELFGPRGACAGCWCMWWRLTRPDFEAGKTGGNREAMRRLLKAGEVPGLLAYEGTVPVGWIALGSRAGYPRLANSRVLAPVDAKSVWSVTCFFVARPHRGKGLTTLVLEAAAKHARKQRLVVGADDVHIGRAVRPDARANRHRGGIGEQLPAGPPRAE